MSSTKEKAPTRQRQGLGVNHSKEIHVADTTTVKSGAQELVRVFNGVIGGLPVQACDGRELHAFLKNGKQFSDWIKQRISQYGFEENQDFSLISPKSEIKKGRGGDRRSVEYHLTLDMAKELSMVENNDQGRLARRYFIDMERKALGQVTLPQPEQFECIFHAFRGSRIEFLYDGKAIWVKASCICTALSIGGSDRIARSLPESRKVYRMRGQQRQVFVDAEAAMRASGYVQRPELAKEWEHWLAEALQAIAPGANPEPPAVEGFDPVERYGLMKLLGTRLLVTLDEHGGPQVRPIPMNSLVVPLDRLADVVSDPCTVPVEYLPGLMQAVAGRLGAAMQRVLPRH